MAAGDFVKGAIGGYEFVDGQYRQNEYDQQRRMAIQTNDERYEQQQARQRRLDAEQMENNQLNRRATEQNMAIQQQGADRQSADFAFNRSRIHQQDTVAQDDRERQETERQRQRLIEENNLLTMRAMAGGSPVPAEHHQRMVEAGLAAHSYYSGIERPDEHKATLALGGILEQLGQGNLNAVNDPAALDVLNTVYADEIKKGIGEVSPRGGKIVEKRIAELRPGPKPGTFGVVLEVTLDNGETYLAPRTRDASANPDDPVRLVDAGVAMDDLMGRYQLARIREQNADKIRQQWEVVSGNQKSTPKLEQVTNEVTGETEFYAWDGKRLQVVEPEQAQADDPFGGDPDDVAAANIMAANPGLSEAEALAYIRQERGATGAPSINRQGALDAWPAGESGQSIETPVAQPAAAAQPETRARPELEVVPSLSQKAGGAVSSYLDQQRAPATTVDQMSTGRASAHDQQQVDWLRSFLSDGKIPGKGLANTGRMRQALDSGLLTEAEANMLRNYLQQ